MPNQGNARTPDNRGQENVVNLLFLQSCCGLVLIFVCHVSSRLCCHQVWNKDVARREWGALVEVSPFVNTVSHGSHGAGR
eukprot:2298074-Rhodomonas_salina.1